MKNKQIQVDEKLITNVYSLILNLHNYELDDNIKNLADIIETQINAKIEAMKKRELYTQSKMAETSEEKESARKQYVEMAGIHKDFRY